MSTIELNHLSFSYDSIQDPIFQDVSLYLDTSWHLGLVGRNGRGKTTLLNILQKKLPFTGTLHANLPIHYFPGNITDETQLTFYAIQDLTNAEQWQIERELNLLNAKPEILWRPFNSLSGGEQTKVLLALLFADDLGFALIDEPTNHLDAADIVLTDDNFASIVAAIEEGRTVYNNIQKFLTYILTSNVPEAFPSILFLFSRGIIPLPMTVMQILTVDLGTDMLPALGLGSEKSEPGIMHQPPRSRSAHLLDKEVIWKAFGWYGLLAAAISSFAYFFTNHLAGWPDVALAASGLTYQRATTMVLGAIVFFQIANALNCRTKITSVFKAGIFSNKRVWFGIAFELTLLIFLVYTPGVQELFNTAPLEFTDWLFLLAIPIPVFLLEEARKWIDRKRRKIN